MNTACEAVRESLSALMDREWPTLGRDEVMAHLSGCADCRRWQDRAHEASRTARLSVPQPPTGLPDSLLAALTGRRWSRWTLPVRVLLGLVGWGIAAFALPALVYGVDAEAPPHVAREMGSLNVGIGLALILVALRPKHAAGVLPLFAAVVALLAVTAGDDMLHGQTTWAHEGPHALVVLALVLLVTLLRLGRAASGPGPRGRGRASVPVTPTGLRSALPRGEDVPRKRAM